MSEDQVGQRLDAIGQQLEELLDDNTAFLAEMRHLDRTSRDAAAAVGRVVDALRQDLETAIAHQALRDLCTELIGPLDAMEAMLAEADFGDPQRIAGHIRGLTATLRGVLTRMGVEVVAITIGEDAFDPERHRCVGVVDPRDSPFPFARPHTVVRVVEHGYQLRERPLRPAQVEIQADQSATRGGVL
ncbi:nucleotide exchange factor GrpE [Micromonospora sp. LA-10]|uniref:nucleotide exchange factor GrpE n=1 Tax=Micromonospora sp. LA-10 TaxID=3446364 RepID=UPI003F72D45E